MKNLLILVAALLLLVTTAHAQTTTTWTGAGTVGAWQDINNWLGGLPGNTKHVIIAVPTALGNTNFPVVSTIGRTCLSLTINAPSGGRTPMLTIDQGKDLTVRTSVTNAGTLANNGLLKMVSNLANNGTIVSGGGSTLEFTNLTVAPPSVTISGGGTTTLNDVIFSNVAATFFTTTNQVRIARVAKVQGFNVAADGRLRLTSDAATTTGMIALTGSGQVTGSISVERAIDPTTNGVLPGNASTGYRHFSTPVANPTFQSMGTAGFTPSTNAAYAYPSNTELSPFPNIFYYNEALLPATVPTRTCGTLPAGCVCAPYSAFEYGWKCPASLTSTLETTRGYTLQIAAAAKVVLLGPANAGPLATALLTKGSNPQSGWHLIGNPYPSPIDMYAVMADNVFDAGTNPGGFDATVYFFHSAPPSTTGVCGNLPSITNGTYQYINTATSEVGAYNAAGAAQPNTLQTRYFPVMQGFFVRKTQTANPQAFQFYDYHRLTTYVPASGTVTPFYRSAAPVAGAGSARNAPITAAGLAAPVPTVEIRLTDEFTGLRDHARATFRAGATAGHDARYDAVRPADNVGNPTLFTVNADGEQCALNALPPLTAPANVPVGLHTLEAGHAYTIAVDKGRLLPGAQVYLTDRQTGRTHDLTRLGHFTFKADAGAYEQRFELRITPAAGATAPTEATLLVTYPNPAQVGSPLEFRSSAVGGSAAVATLFDAFGRVVSTQKVAVQDGKLTGKLATAGLKAGIYTLRLNAENTVATQRIEIR